MIIFGIVIAYFFLPAKNLEMAVFDVINTNVQ